MGNILDLLIDYSDKEKILDFDYITKVVEIAIKEKSLEEYINGVEIHENLSNVYNVQCGGIYSTDSLKITISQHMIDEYYKRVHKSSAERLSVYDELLLSNSLSTQVILHEIEHANQLKKIDEGKNFESSLLKAAYSFYLNVYDKDLGIGKLETFDYMSLKQSYGPIMPHERLADINSMYEIVDILEPIYDYVHPKIKQFMETRLYKFYTKGYSDEDLEPTESYLADYTALNIPGTERHFNDEFYNFLALEKESELKNRMLYGLGITKNEYDMCKVKKKK